MGWWSETIMGGDTPLDIESVIYDALGIEMFSPKRDIKRKLPKDQLQRKQNEVVKAVLDLEDGYDADTVGLQVVGVLMMAAGAKISPKNKALILKGARKDEWAKNDSTRKAYIKSFISTVKSYTGRKPVDIETETLGEVFSKKSGPVLINKNI